MIENTFMPFDCVLFAILCLKDKTAFFADYCARAVVACLALDSGWHNLARFGETFGKAYLCLSKKRKGAGSSSFRVFGANYPI